MDIASNYPDVRLTKGNRNPRGYKAAEDESAIRRKPYKQGSGANIAVNTLTNVLKNRLGGDAYKVMARNMAVRMQQLDQITTMNMEMLASAMLLVRTVVGDTQQFTKLDDGTSPQIDEVVNRMEQTDILGVYTNELFGILIGAKANREETDESLLIRMRTRAGIYRYVLLVIDYYAGITQ